MTFRRIRRLLTITRVILVYGLEDIFPHKRLWQLTVLKLCFFWWRNQHTDKSAGERLRLALIELGPIFVKFGQLLATRQDILRPDIVKSLQSLQDKVPPFDAKTSKAMIQANLPQAIDVIFEEFSQEPVASASIAQVHFARLSPEYAQQWQLGQDVAVKVVRPKIKQKIARDIHLLHWLAKLFEQYHVDGKRLKASILVHDYEATIYQELDMEQEARNTQRLRNNAQTIEKLYVPQVFNSLSNQNILVLERIKGIPVNDVESLKAAGTHFEKLANAGTEIFFTQVFRDSFFHADMHAGNIFVDVSDPDNPSYIGIDCGICGTLNKQDKRYLAENLLAFFNQDYRKVAELHVYSGWVNPATNIEEFTQAIEEVCAPIFGKPLSEIAVGDFLLHLFNTARRFDMEVQPQLVLLQKTLLYIEGLGRRLYPELDLWTTAKPFLEDWVKEQVGLKSAYSDFKNHGAEWRMTLPEIPQRLHAYLHREPMQSYQQLQAIQKLQFQLQKQSNKHNRLISGLILLCLGYFSQQLGNDWNWVSYLLSASGIIALFCGWFNWPHIKKMGA